MWLSVAPGPPLPLRLHITTWMAGCKGPVQPRTPTEGRRFAIQSAPSRDRPVTSVTEAEGVGDHRITPPYITLSWGDRGKVQTLCQHLNHIKNNHYNEQYNSWTCRHCYTTSGKLSKREKKSLFSRIWTVKWLWNTKPQKCKGQMGKLLWPKEIVINKIYTVKKIVKAKL